MPFKALWSEIRECLLYIGQADRIEAWDLLSSDLSPIKVVAMEKLTDFATFITGDREYLVRTVLPASFSVLVGALIHHVH